MVDRDHTVAGTIAVRGAGQLAGQPWTVSVAGTEVVVDTSAAATGATSTIDNSLVLVVASTGTDTGTDQWSAWVNGDLTSVTEQQDHYATDGSGGGFAITTGIKALAGSFGATTATLATAAPKSFITLVVPSGVSGDANITDDDDFTLSETQSHDQQVITGPGPVVPPPLPAVRHVIRSDSGVAYPQVSGWTAEEAAPGGYGPATGTMALAELHAAPHLYVVGATWQMWAGSEILWEGILLDPIIDGAEARLVGRGWGQVADREVQRILYLSRNYSDWVPGDSDPFNYAAAEAWSVSADGGRLQFVGRKGDDVAEGNKASLVFHAEGSEVTSIAGTIDANPLASNGNQEIRVGSTSHPGTIVQAGADVNPSDGNAFTRTFTGADKDVAQIRIERTGGPGTFSGTVKVAVRDLRLRGVADEDEMASSEVVADVFDRLGIEAQFIEASGDDAMPLDVKGGTLGDVLDHCSLLTGTPWRIVSSGAARVGTFRDGAGWLTFTDDGDTDLLPVQRYNRVTVRFKSVSGRTRQVTATPDDIGLDDPYTSTGAVFNYALEVNQAHPDADKMRALAERLLGGLIVERYTGSLDRAWLTDTSGALRSAYAIQAGDRVRVGDALGEQPVTVTIATKVSSPDGVRLTMAASVPELDRYEARRAGGG